MITYVIAQYVQVDGEFMKSLPAIAKVIFGALAAFVIFGVGFKYFADGANIFKARLIKRKIKKDVLKNHAFFNKCDAWYKYKINDLYFGDEIRNKLFRAILGAKINTMSEMAINTLESCDLRNLNKHCFSASIQRMLTNMRVESDLRIKNKILELYPDKGAAIYELVIRHEDRGFDAFNVITDNYTERLVYIICESDIYRDNYEKYDMILDALMAALGAAFPHIEATFKGFNGDLDDIIKDCKK